jgi:hypothetical protein
VDSPGRSSLSSTTEDLRLELRWSHSLATMYLNHCYTTFGLPIKDFHPAADGQSERTNQNVEFALRCFLGGDTERYSDPDGAPVLEHEKSSTTNSTTGFPPTRIAIYGEAAWTCRPFLPHRRSVGESGALSRGTQEQTR